MSHLFSCAYDKLCSPPAHVIEGLQYEVIMGSSAYGVATDNSDLDIYGFSIPSKEIVFPHLAGEIPGFGKKIQRFEQYQEHHIKTTKREYDFSVYNIVKYFQLCMDNNPNMIDSLFVPNRCITYSTKIGDLVRENRKMFLHKGSYHKFKGYAYSQLNKINNKNPDKKGKRYKLVQKYGYDIKYAYHLVRLLNEAEQILMTGDLDLEQNREQLKSIRRGAWTKEQIIWYFERKESSLEKLYTESTLQHRPDEAKIKQLLLQCLEEYYGSIDHMIIEIPNLTKSLLNDITELADKYKGKMK